MNTSGRRRIEYCEHPQPCFECGSSPFCHDSGHTEVCEPVTLCIAAECTHGDPAIVLCCDWRAQTGSEGSLLIGTEDVYKIREFGEDMAVMIAGNPSDAHELLTACKGAIQRFGEVEIKPEDVDIAVAAFQSELRTAAAKRKEEIINTFLLNSIGMTRNEFIKTRDSDFTDVHRDLWAQVRQLNLGADLLICGFCADTSVIIRLDRFGRTPWETNYATTGEGSDAARIMLSLQPWDWIGSTYRIGPFYPVKLSDCIFRVYEAKTVAHRVHPSSVGEVSAIQVLIRGRGRHGVDHAFFNAMVDQFHSKHSVPQAIRHWDASGKPILGKNELYLLR